MKQKRECDTSTMMHCARVWMLSFLLSHVPKSEPFRDVTTSREHFLHRTPQPDRQIKLCPWLQWLRYVLAGVRHQDPRVTMLTFDGGTTHEQFARTQSPRLNVSRSEVSSQQPCEALFALERAVRLRKAVCASTHRDVSLEMQKRGAATIFG